MIFSSHLSYFLFLLLKTQKQTNRDGEDWERWEHLHIKWVQPWCNVGVSTIYIVRA